jgi:hypothetical protein
MIIYEHRLFTDSGFVAFVDTWCERHWHLTGLKLYERDVGPKTLRWFEVSEVHGKQMCTICREKGETHQ